jgi:hypothetical protein
MGGIYEVSRWNAMMYSYIRSFIKTDWGIHKLLGGGGLHIQTHRQQSEPISLLYSNQAPPQYCQKRTYHLNQCVTSTDFRKCGITIERLETKTYKQLYLFPSIERLYRYALSIYYMFRHFGHHHVCTLTVGCTAHPLHWPVFTVDTFCVVGLIYWA